MAMAMAIQFLAENQFQRTNGTDYTIPTSKKLDSNLGYFASDFPTPTFWNHLTLTPLTRSHQTFD
jgi:hypothetical protein